MAEEEAGWPRRGDRDRVERLPKNFEKYREKGLAAAEGVETLIAVGLEASVRTPDDGSVDGPWTAGQSAQGKRRRRRRKKSSGGVLPKSRSESFESAGSLGLGGTGVPTPYDSEDEDRDSEGPFETLTSLESSTQGGPLHHAGHGQAHHHVVARPTVQGSIYPEAVYEQVVALQTSVAPNMRPIANVGGGRIHTSSPARQKSRGKEGMPVLRAGKVGKYEDRVSAPSPAQDYDFAAVISGGEVEGLIVAEGADNIQSTASGPKAEEIRKALSQWGAKESPKVKAKERKGREKHNHQNGEEKRKEEREGEKVSRERIEFHQEQARRRIEKALAEEFAIDERAVSREAVRRQGESEAGGPDIGQDSGAAGLGTGQRGSGRDEEELTWKVGEKKVVRGGERVHEAKLARAQEGREMVRLKREMEAAKMKETRDREEDRERRQQVAKAAAERKRISEERTAAAYQQALGPGHAGVAGKKGKDLSKWEDAPQKPLKPWWYREGAKQGSFDVKVSPGVDTDPRVRAFLGQQAVRRYPAEYHLEEDEFRKIADDEGIRDRDYRMHLMDMSMTDDDAPEVNTVAQHGFAPEKYQHVASGLLAGAETTGRRASLTSGIHERKKAELPKTAPKAKSETEQLADYWIKSHVESYTPTLVERDGGPTPAPPPLTKPQLDTGSDFNPDDWVADDFGNLIPKASLPGYSKQAAWNIEGVGGVVFHEYTGPAIQADAIKISEGFEDEGWMSGSDDEVVEEKPEEDIEPVKKEELVVEEEVKMPGFEEEEERVVFIFGMGESDEAMVSEDSRPSDGSRDIENAEREGEAMSGNERLNLGAAVFGSMPGGGAQWQASSDGGSHSSMGARSPVGDSGEVTEEEVRVSDSADAPDTRVDDASPKAVREVDIWQRDAADGGGTQDGAFGHPEELGRSEESVRDHSSRVSEKQDSQDMERDRKEVGEAPGMPGVDVSKGKDSAKSAITADAWELDEQPREPEQGDAKDTGGYGADSNAAAVSVSIDQPDDKEKRASQRTGLLVDTSETNVKPGDAPGAGASVDSPPLANVDTPLTATFEVPPSVGAQGDVAEGKDESADGWSIDTSVVDTSTQQNASHLTEDTAVAGKSSIAPGSPVPGANEDAGQGSDSAMGTLGLDRGVSPNKGVSPRGRRRTATTPLRAATPLQVPTTHLEEDGEEDDREREPPNHGVVSPGGVVVKDESGSQEQDGEVDRVRGHDSRMQARRESSASARPSSMGSDGSMSMRSFGPRLTGALDGKADVLNLEAAGHASRPLTGVSVQEVEGINETFDKIFDEFVDESGPGMFDDKALPLAERVRAAAELMDSITEKDGKLWLIKKMLQERERDLEKRFEKLKKDHKIAYQEMNQGGKVAEQGKLITDLSMQVEAHKKQIAHLQTQMSPDFHLYRALEKLESHIDSKEIKMAKRNELLMFRSVLLQKRAQRIDAKEKRVEDEKNRLMAIERSIVMAEKKLSEIQSIASRQKEVADGVARVEEFERQRKLKEDSLREREMRLMRDEEKVMKAKAEAVGLRDELDRKRIEMDVDMMDLREAAWREHKARFPSIYTKKVMVSRHFSTGKELMMMEGHHRSHEALSPVVPKTAPIGLPIRYASPTSSQTSPNTPFIAKYAVGNNALRPRTVLTSPSRPYSRALAAGGLPSSGQGMRPRDGTGSPAKDSAISGGSVDSPEFPHRATRTPLGGASFSQSVNASHQIMTLTSPVLAPLHTRSPSRAGAMHPGSVFSLKDGRQHPARALSRGAPQVSVPEPPGPWGSHHYDEDASEFILHASQIAKVPRSIQNERATVHPTWTARAWGKEGHSL